MRISSPGICGPRMTRKLPSRARVSDGSAARAVVLEQTTRRRNAVKERSAFMVDDETAIAVRGCVVGAIALARLTRRRAGRGGDGVPWRGQKRRAFPAILPG